MKNLDELTVLIVTYKTDKNILINCIKSINKKVKILIVENSNKFEHAKSIRKYKNTKYICSGKNLGYGGGNNYGLKKIKTKYVLILNPDILCDKYLFKNISILLRNKTNFHIIGCQYLKDKIYMPAGFFNKNENQNFKDKFMKNNIKTLTRVEWVTGCSMLINLKKFKQNKIFDENYFLYFEEIDLCKYVIKRGGNIFTCKDLKIHHLGFKSSLGKNLNDKINTDLLREWHWMWSSFYFYKKHNNYLFACYKLIGKFIKSFIKTVFYSITFNKILKNKYKHRFLGIYHSMLNKPSDFRN